MEDKRRAEIGLAMLRLRIREEGITLKPANIKRMLGNISKKTKIPLDELTEFAKTEILALVKECFS